MQRLPRPLAALVTACTVTGALAQIDESRLRSLSIGDLQQAYLACNRAASRVRLDAATVAGCSVVSDELQRRAFGGDSERLAAWARSRDPAAQRRPHGAGAAPPRLADRLHAAAVESFRQARFAEAYGRFMALADAGHAPSAGIALWMWQHGPDLFGKDWDCSGEQLEAWSRLAGVPTPPLLARSYGRQVLGGDAPRPAARRPAPQRAG